MSATVNALGVVVFFGAASITFLVMKVWELEERLKRLEERTKPEAK